MARSASITCYLCRFTAELELLESDHPWYPTTWVSPKPWVRGRTSGGDSVDFCCKDHRNYYQQAIEIGPPTVKLLFEIFRPH